MKELRRKEEHDRKKGGKQERMERQGYKFMTDQDRARKSKLAGGDPTLPQTTR